MPARYRWKLDAVDRRHRPLESGGDGPLPGPSACEGRLGISLDHTTDVVDREPQLRLQVVLQPRQQQLPMGEKPAAFVVDGPPARHGGHASSARAC